MKVTKIKTGRNRKLQVQVKDLSDEEKEKLKNVIRTNAPFGNIK